MECRCVVLPGVLRLGAFWRQQPSFLHDPEQKLHDELVTLRPMTLLFLTLNSGPHLERDGMTRLNVCVWTFCQFIDGQSNSVHPHVDAPVGGAVRVSARRRWLCLPGLVDVPEGFDLTAMSCREAFDRELWRSSLCSTFDFLQRVHTASVLMPLPGFKDGSSRRRKLWKRHLILTQSNETALSFLWKFWLALTWRNPPKKQREPELKPHR